MLVSASDKRQEKEEKGSNSQAKQVLNHQTKASELLEILVTIMMFTRSPTPIVCSVEIN
jgi:predicted transposase YdaD